MISTSWKYNLFHMNKSKSIQTTLADFVKVGPFYYRQTLQSYAGLSKLAEDRPGGRGFAPMKI
jgi:hypothetical protein